MDYFSFQGWSGREYTIEVLLNGHPDTYLTLFDGTNGLVLAENDDASGLGAGSRIIWTSPRTGDYFLEVRSFSTGMTGSYTLILTEEGSAGLTGSDGATGIVSRWPGEGNAQDIVDGNNGTLEGGTTFAPGEVGQAFSFDGTDDFVEIHIDVSEANYTLELWFQTSSPDVGVFEIHDFSGGHDRHIYLASGNICTRVWSDEVICTSGTNYADGRWHHVAHVFGGDVGGQNIFVDGQQEASGSKANSDFNWQTGANIGFSRDSANGYFNGLIDEVAVYNRALTAAEINAIYVAVSAGATGSDGATASMSDITDDFGADLDLWVYSGSGANWQIKDTSLLIDDVRIKIEV